MIQSNGRARSANPPRSARDRPPHPDVSLMVRGVLAGMSVPAMTSTAMTSTPRATVRDAAAPSTAPAVPAVSSAPAITCAVGVAAPIPTRPAPCVIVPAVLSSAVQIRRARRNRSSASDRTQHIVRGLRLRGLGGNAKGGYQAADRHKGNSTFCHRQLPHVAAALLPVRGFPRQRQLNGRPESLRHLRVATLGLLGALAINWSIRSRSRLKSASSLPSNSRVRANLTRIGSTKWPLTMTS